MELNLLLWAPETSLNLNQQIATTVYFKSIFSLNKQKKEFKASTKYLSQCASEGWPKLLLLDVFSMNYNQSFRDLENIVEAKTALGAMTGQWIAHVSANLVVVCSNPVKVVI